jgi:signal transduction histidine kinase
MPDMRNEPMATRAARRMSAAAPRLWALRRQLLMLFVPWVLIVTPLGVIIHDRMVQGMRKPVDTQRQELLARASQVLSRSLISMQRDIRFIASSDELRDAIIGNDYDRLARLLQHFAIASGQYTQLRWIDSSGLETVRVDYADGKAAIRARDALQNKAARSYFREAIQGEPGEIYLSRLDLNIENEKVEIPYKPMLRIAMPVSRTGDSPNGIVILNYLADTLLARLRMVGGASDAEVHLFNEQGYWLLAPRPELAWGFMTGDATATLPRHAPDVWRAMTTQESGSFNAADRAWSFRRLSPLSDVLAPTQSASHAAESWRLAIAIPTASLVRQSREAAWFVGAATLALLLAAFMGTVRLVLTGDDRERALTKVRDNETRLASANGELQDALAHLRTMQGELIRAEKLSSLGMMVAGVAHELNTPLGSAVITVSTLRRHLDTLAERIESGALRRSDLDVFIGEGRDGLTFAAEALDRAAVLVRRFKQLAVDRATTERRRFELADVLDDSLHLLRHRTTPGTPRVLLDIPRPLPMNSYAGALGQIVSNLVDNALRHAFTGTGSGTVRVTAQADGTTDEVRIEVIDDGCGMSADVATHAFDPFFTTRRGQGGTGLGLFMAHQLAADVLGGHLSLDSVPGKGSTFTLRVPCTAPQLAVSDTSGAAGATQ